MRAASFSLYEVILFFASIKEIKSKKRYIEKKHTHQHLIGIMKLKRGCNAWSVEESNRFFIILFIELELLLVFLRIRWLLACRGVIGCHFKFWVEKNTSTHVSVRHICMEVNRQQSSIHFLLHFKYTISSFRQYVNETSYGWMKKILIKSQFN